MDTKKVDQLSKEMAVYCQKIILQAKRPSKKRTGPVLPIVISALMSGVTTDQSGSWHRSN